MRTKHFPLPRFEGMTAAVEKYAMVEMHASSLSGMWSCRHLLPSMHRRSGGERLAAYGSDSAYIGLQIPTFLFTRLPLISPPDRRIRFVPQLFSHVFQPPYIPFRKSRTSWQGPLYLHHVVAAGGL